MNGTECRPQAPVAEGGPVGFSDGGEPTGLVPLGPGATGGLSAVLLKLPGGCAFKGVSLFMQDICETRNLASF